MTESGSACFGTACLGAAVHGVECAHRREPYLYLCARAHLIRVRALGPALDVTRVLYNSYAVITHREKFG